MSSSASDAYSVSRISWMAGASTVKEGDGGLREEEAEGEGEGVREREGPADRDGVVGDIGGWRNVDCE